MTINSKKKHLKINVENITHHLVGRPRTKFTSIEEELEYVKLQNKYLKKCIVYN